MHFAVLANGIEHAAGGYFTVDRHCDRRPDVSILVEQLVVDTRETLAEAPDQFANRFSRNPDSLDAAGEFA